MSMIGTMDQTLDLPALMDRLGGDRELLLELIGLYLEDEQGLIDQITEAVKNGQPDVLRRAAHTLKGSVGNFCAAPAHGVAAALEAAGRAGTMDGTPALLDRLVVEFDRVRTALKALAAQSQ
jgi:two-component system, sensor histidine kinase and response regulator